MSPSPIHPSVIDFGDVKRIRFLDLDHVMGCLDEPFVEPVTRAAMLPGYPAYASTVGEHDGWPDAPEPVAFTRTDTPKGQRYQIVSGVHVLSAAVQWKKAKVPCYFLHRDEIGRWASIAGRFGLRPDPIDAESEEMLIRNYFSA